jgi:hypothetical protein
MISRGMLLYSQLGLQNAVLVDLLYFFSAVIFHSFQHERFFAILAGVRPNRATAAFCMHSRWDLTTVLWQEEHEKQCCSPVPALSLFPKL